MRKVNILVRERHSRALETKTVYVEQSGSDTRSDVERKAESKLWESEDPGKYDIVEITPL